MKNLAGVTGKSLGNHITAYPKCPVCSTAYVLRLSDVLVGGTEWRSEWIFQKDCKHKKAPIFTTYDPGRPIRERQSA